MYRQTGFCRFLRFFGLWKINNLLVFSAPWRFDSVPGHYFNGRRRSSIYLSEESLGLGERFRLLIDFSTLLTDSCIQQQLRSYCRAQLIRSVGPSLAEI